MRTGSTISRWHLASRVLLSGNFTASAAALSEKLGLIASQAPQVMAGELYREAQGVMSTALPITPILTGALRRSGHVDEPEIAGETISVTLGFGGDAAPYAVYVHENLVARHNPPTQAKFLEVPLNDALPGMPDRIAASAAAKLGLG